MQKKFLLRIIVGIMAFSLLTFGSITPTAEAATASGAPDYSQKASWCKLPNIISKEVDTFYIYSTSYMESSFKEGAPDYAPLDNPEMLELAQEECIAHATVFEDSTNVFVPYYRQAGLRVQLDAWQKTGDARNALKDNTPYTDITAALDYYFENYNGGRPFIIAGHSQGSALTSLVLMKYFKEHPEYYKRMVAAYVIGYSITKDDLKASPHLKFATGEKDTGVIVSWNTEGRENVKENAKNVAVLPGAISINPLNWKRDETYAPSSKNLGSLIGDEKLGMGKLGDVGADAQINLARGVIVTNAKADPVPMPDFFGPASFHDNDYTFYYNNIRDNVAKRIAAYEASR